VAERLFDDDARPALAMVALLLESNMAKVGDDLLVRGRGSGQVE
jgi:hypothetical protein